MTFILTLLWNWLKDAQFHKTAASTAAGTSLGLLTVMGVLEQKLETVKAEVTVEIQDVKAHIEQVDSFVQYRKQLTDERFDHIDKNLTYMRGAIDVVNQNILNLSHDSKRSR